MVTTQWSTKPWRTSVLTAARTPRGKSSLPSSTSAPSLSSKRMTTQVPLQPFIHLVIQPFIHSFIQIFIHSFIQSFVHLFIHQIIHSSNHSFNHSFIKSFIHQIIHSSNHSFNHSFILLFIQSIFYFMCIYNPIHMASHSNPILMD